MSSADNAEKLADNGAPLQRAIDGLAVRGGGALRFAGGNVFVPRDAAAPRDARGCRRAGGGMIDSPPRQV